MLRLYKWCMNKVRCALAAVRFLLTKRFLVDAPRKARTSAVLKAFSRVLFALLAGIVLIYPTCYSAAFGPNDFTYTGTYVWVDDGGINFRLKFTGSGTFTPKKPLIMDLFLLGAGAGGANRVDTSGAAGGAGGCAGTWTSVSLNAGQSYSVVIGAGGAAGANGGASSFNGTYSMNGGLTPSPWYAGSNGGSGSGAGGASSAIAGGNGGTNGGNGGASSPRTGGTGQGTPTYEFGDASLPLYAGAGGGGAAVGGAAGTGGLGGGANGGAANSNGSNAAANTGGGGGGAGGSSTAKSGGLGGSGLCVIRNHR